MRQYSYPPNETADSYAKVITFSELREASEAVPGFKEWFCKKFPDTSYILSVAEDLHCDNCVYFTYRPIPQMLATGCGHPKKSYFRLIPESADKTAPNWCPRREVD